MVEMHKRKLNSVSYSRQLQKLYDVPPSSSNAYRTIEDGERHIKCVAFSPDELFFAWTRGKHQVVITEWKKSERQLYLSDPDELQANVTSKYGTKVINTGLPVVCLAFGSSTPDHVMQAQENHFRYFDPQKVLIFATGHKNGKIRLWDMMNCKLKLELDDHKDVVKDLGFAPDGSLIISSASYDKTIKMWNLMDEGNMFKTLKGHRDKITSCSWSPTAKQMASCGLDKQILIWNMLTYCLSFRLEGHLHTVSACEFSPDGALLVSASYDTRCNVWDAHKGSLLFSLNHLYPPPSMIYAMGSNGHWVKGCKFLPSGDRVVTYSDDNYLRIWNLNDIDDPEFSTILEEVCYLQVSPSGGTLVAGTTTGHLHFFAIPGGIPRLSHLARVVVRKLTKTLEVNKLPVPAKIKGFLKYNYWSL